MSAHLIRGGGGDGNEPGSEDPVQVVFRPARMVLDALTEMWEPFAWLDQQRQSRRPLFEPAKAAELIHIIPPGHRIAEAGALFLQAEEVPAPESWVHLAVGMMLQSQPNPISFDGDAYRCTIADGLYADPEVSDWGRYLPGFSAAVIVRTIRQIRRECVELPHPGRFINLCVEHREWFKKRHADMGTLMDLRYEAEDALEAINPEHPLLAGRYEDGEDLIPF
jgi:hypothetical protein